MKKVIFLSVGVAAILMQSASAQTSLFTTTGDFASGSGSIIVAPTTSVDYDGSTINGLGNTTAPGGAGTAGSESLTWVSGSYDYAYFSPGEQGNAPFIAALENASTFTFDYQTPPPGTGSYFQLNLVLNYQGGFDTLSGTTTSLGGGWTQNAINFTSEAASLIAAQAANGGGFSYFQLGVNYNSNYNTPSSPFSVDNFTVTPAPEPTTLALIGLGAVGLMAIRRRKA
jgi:hypothetical protein